MTDPTVLSPTQINMFGRCPEQYRRRYLEHERLPPGVANLRGRAFHRAASHNFHQKVRSRVDLPEEELVDTAATAFDEEAHGADVALTDEERARGNGVALGEAKDSAIRLTRLHRALQAPNYQPTLVEERAAIRLGPELHVQGVLDLVDDQHALIDLKTAKKSKPPAEAHDSIQLTTYSALLKAKTGRPPSRIALDVLVDTKVARRQVLETSRTEGDFRALAARVESLQHAVEVGSFPPTSPNNWQCSPNWCGYYKTCRYVNGGAR